MKNNSQQGRRSFGEVGTGQEAISGINIVSSTAIQTRGHRSRYSYLAALGNYYAAKIDGDYGAG
jgi:hypothetical protein